MNEQLCQMLFMLLDGVLRIVLLYYLFGKAKGKHNRDLLPMPERVGRNTLSWRFRQAVRTLHRSGALPDIRGIEFYSLKDTLAIYLLDNGVDVSRLW